MCQSHNYHWNTWRERIKFFTVFLHYGIKLNLFNGKITFLPFKKKCCCSQLKLIRHGATLAVDLREFMSNTSENSSLSEKGIHQLEIISSQIRKDMPDIVIVAPLKRTQDTWNILKYKLNCDVEVVQCDYLVGINNSVWAGKTFEELHEEELWLFLRRECDHNTLVKTEGGDSWGDVIYRCIKVFEVLNDKYGDKKVLLISQGSIYQAFKILLHLCHEPWDGYSAEKMFHLSQSGTDVGYGKIIKLI